MTLVVVLYINPKTQSLCYYTMFLCKKVFVLSHHVPMQDTSLCVLTACSYARHSLCFYIMFLCKAQSLCFYSMFLWMASLCVFKSCSYARHNLCVVISYSYARYSVV